MRTLDTLTRLVLPEPPMPVPAVAECSTRRQLSEGIKASGLLAVPDGARPRCASLSRIGQAVRDS